MTPLVMTIVVVPTVLTIGTYMVSRLVGHVPASIGTSLWIGNVILVIVSVVVGVFLYDDQQIEYEACLSRVEGRTVVDDGFGKLADGLARVGVALEPYLPVDAAVKEALDNLTFEMDAVAVGLTPLDPADCKRPLTLGW